MMGPEDITYFAETDFRSTHRKFGIKQKDRSRHVYVIGKTGMGKSTMLENMAVQDIQSGNGLCFIDPHGKTAELLLDYVPEDRIDDVLYFAPFDLGYPVSFNVMEDVGDERRHLVASGLMSAFKKIWVDMWSARMEYILNNALLALLEYPDATLLGVNRMLADTTYRKRVVSNISDVSVKAFWQDEFEKYGQRYMQEAGASIQNKIGQFVSNPLVRNIIGQPHSSFDMRKMMDEKKIVIVNLSKGRVGEDNANLIGSMLITKLYLSAMSRADLRQHEVDELPPFYFYVDEFQSFANESFADILSEARKYKLALTLAHQYVEQMTDEIKAAVFGNVGTLVSFRVGALDAELLEKEFAPQFTAEDVVNLGFAQIYLRLMIDGVGSKPFSARTMGPIPEPNQSYRDMIIERSRKRFAKIRSEVEEDLINWHRSSAGLITDTPREEKNEQKQVGGKKGGKRQGGEDRLQKAMSIQQLRQRKQEEQVKAKKKKPSEENLDKLRSALSDVLGTVVPGSQKPDKVEKKEEGKDNQKAENQSRKSPKDSTDESTDKSKEQKKPQETPDKRQERREEKPQEKSQEKSQETSKSESKPESKLAPQEKQQKVEEQEEKEEARREEERARFRNENRPPAGPIELPEDELRRLLEVSEK